MNGLRKCVTGLSKNWSSWSLVAHHWVFEDIIRAGITCWLTTASLTSNRWNLIIRFLIISFLTSLDCTEQKAAWKMVHSSRPADMKLQFSKLQVFSDGRWGWRHNFWRIKFSLISIRKHARYFKSLSKGQHFGAILTTEHQRRNVMQFNLSSSPPFSVIHNLIRF